MRILYTNAQSLQNKVQELEAVVTDLNPDVILITETWCNPEIPDAALSISGYNIETDLRRDRRDTGNGVGGGLLVYSKLGSKILPLDNFINNDFNQFCAFSTGTKRDSLKFVLCYRPPNSGPDNTDKLCEILRTMPLNTIMIGDVNMPNINWETLRADRKGRALAETVEEEGLEQLVEFSTHIKGNILDLAITNCPERFIGVSDEGRLGKSDHCMLLFEFEGSVNQVEAPENGRNWSKANMTGLEQKFNKTPWKRHLNDMSAEQSWYYFRKKLDSCIEEFVPRFRNKRKQRPPWLSQEIIRELRSKKTAWRQWKATGDASKKTKYEQLRKSVTHKIRTAKRRLEKELADAGRVENKKFTRYIKSKSKNKTTIGPLQGLDGRRLIEDIDMAQELNRQFSSVFTDEDTVTIPTPEKEDDIVIDNILVTEGIVRREILKLKADSAPGPDGITPKLLKSIVNSVTTPLTIIFKKSIETGEIPKDWRMATVVPIFKKGQKKDPANYRPVSLTSIPCKILEKIVKEQIMKHLVTNNLIRDSQHGFFPGRSCATNLILTMDYLTRAVDQGVPVDLIYLDFSKAFDKVPHRRLISKVKAKGIKGKLAEWIENWLKNRTQKVKVQNVESGESSVKSGVPQGTILGPCLFDIYIDDLDVVVAKLAEIIKFADDTKTYKTIRSLADRDSLQMALDNLCRWASIWGMEFNTAKCKVMHVGRNNPEYQYSMNGTTLETTDSEQDLGVIMDRSLKPTNQCRKAAAKARTVLMQILRNFHYRDKHHFIRLYKQYVRPHLEFSSPAWSPWTAADKELLESVQEKAVRNTAGLKGATYIERCTETGLEGLEERRRKQDLMQTFKIVKGFDKVDSEKVFKKMTHRAGTRLAADPWNLQKDRATKEVRMHSFSVRVVDHWNQLEARKKSLSNPSAFKRSLKN
jgi:hypothetical protein